MQTQINKIKELCAKTLAQLQKAEKDRYYYDNLTRDKTEENLELNEELCNMNCNLQRTQNKLKRFKKYNSNNNTSIKPNSKVNPDDDPFAALNKLMDSIEKE